MAIPVMRQPLNLIENPVNPSDYIVRDPPRSISSGKAYHVNVGHVLRSTGVEENVAERSGAILTIPYDKNQTRYGTSSTKFVVNKNFRPKLIPPKELSYSLSRMPVDEVEGRINPMGGTYRPDVTGTIHVEPAIKRDVLVTSIPATYVVNMGQNIHATFQNASPIRLEYGTPRVSVSSGINIPFTSDEGQRGEYVMEWFDGDFKRPDVPLHTGRSYELKINAPDPTERVVLKEQLHAYDVSAGTNIPADTIIRDTIDRAVRPTPTIVSYAPSNRYDVTADNINRNLKSLEQQTGRSYVPIEAVGNIPTYPKDHPVKLREKGVSISNVKMY